MKKITPLFWCNIVNSVLKLSGAERDRMNTYIKTLKDGKYDLIIKKHTNQRTNPQNFYYFGVVLVILGDFHGYDVEEMHEEMKRKFNPVESKFTPGEFIGGTTKNMTTEEFFSDEQSYVNRIRRWAAMEFGICTPDPERVEQ